MKKRVKTLMPHNRSIAEYGMTTLGGGTPPQAFFKHNGTVYPAQLKAGGVINAA